MITHTFAGTGSRETVVVSGHLAYPRWVRGLLALGVLSAFVWHAGAQAQQKDDARRAKEAAAREAELIRRRALEAAAVREKMVAEQAAVAAAARAGIARQVISNDQFEQMIFQQDRNAAGARQRLESALASQVSDIDRACELTDAQKKKLQLTGRGDVKRFFDAVEAAKQKLQSINNDAQQLQEIMQEINPLRVTLQAGLFQDDSLLHKSLRNTLTADQFAKYDAVVRERRAFRHRAAVTRAVAMIEQHAPLRDEQRRELITLLTNETKPPRKSGQYDLYVVIFQIGRLPEEKLKPLFSDTQWRVVTRLVDQYRAVEPTLRQQGLLSDEEEDDRAADARPPAPKK
jgi:hypothetical protein